MIREETQKDVGIIYMGSMENSIQEIDDIIEETGLKVSQCRVRAVPLHPDIEAFIERHNRVIVLEINRDGQLYGVLRKELPINLVPKISSVAYSDGMPPRARIYADLILEVLKEGHNEQSDQTQCDRQAQERLHRGPSSLCPGCGHDQISGVIIQACWENGIEPNRIAKMSGIGCSSKTPAYFLGQSHGFNTVTEECHQLPPVPTWSTRTWSTSVFRAMVTLQA